mmetsp:Transcript_22020/g.32703  ORF Transcript_22020/g.32703 Transcript_22020/m.32703 type:complete len:276 (-) Transcript_22020:234-1061(-)
MFSTALYKLFLYAVLATATASGFIQSQYNNHNFKVGHSGSDTFVSSCSRSKMTCFPSFSPAYLNNRQRKSLQLSMGLFDFLKNRSNDFVKLDSSKEEYGPGPLLLLYNVPSGIEDAEFRDMVEDGAPRATASSAGGVVVRRLMKGDKKESSLLDASLSEALEDIAKQGKEVEGGEAKSLGIIDQFGTIPSPGEEVSASSGSPVLFFSGFSNSEMMDTYRIIASEIYEESGRTLSAACAKAVPNAMNKPLIQVLEEISGDHADAMKMQRKQQQQQQ